MNLPINQSSIQNSENNLLANVLVIGSGGREHALCWKLAQSAKIGKIYCAPGNGGTYSESKTQNIDIAVDDFEKLRQFAIDNQISLTVIGPDNPLAEGIVDFFQTKQLPVFGPKKEAAKLEWSKAYAKQFMTQVGIPTARYAVCQTNEQASTVVSQNQWARVVKADGLALGKGVFVCDSEDECKQALAQIFENKIFGEAGKTALIEEKIKGEEISLLLFCDGNDILAMPASQDHKRRFDNDEGPNTGGMGVYSPVALYERFKLQIESQVLQPLRDALKNKIIDFQGIIYAGLMIGKTEESARSEPETDKLFVLEFNARFGDPETQALMPLLESDLYEILHACVNKTLNQINVKWKNACSCSVIAAARDYPQTSSKNEKITFNERLDSSSPDVYVFHAGTKILDGQLLTNGGRVLAVTAIGSTMEEARTKAYKAIKTISFKDISYREDIGGRAVNQCLST